MIRTRAARWVIVCLLPLLFVGSALAQNRVAPPPAAARTAPPPAARTAPAPGAVRAGGTIATIKVEGNQRIETGTILSYMLVQPGDPFDPDRLDRSLKTLYATGLFQDVRLDPRRRHPGGARGREPAGQPGRLRGQSQVDRRSASVRRCSSGRAPCSRRPWPRRTASTSSICTPDSGYYDARVEPQIIRLRRIASTWSTRSTTAA